MRYNLQSICFINHPGLFGLCLSQTQILVDTHSDPHKAVSEYNPRQQEDEGLVTTEQRWGVSCVDLPEGLQVQVVGEDPQQAKGSHLGEKHLGCQPVIPEKPTALPVPKHNAEHCVSVMQMWDNWEGDEDLGMRTTLDRSDRRVIEETPI